MTFEQQPVLYQLSVRESQVGRLVGALRDLVEGVEVFAEDDLLEDWLPYLNAKELLAEVDPSGEAAPSGREEGHDA